MPLTTLYLVIIWLVGWWILAVLTTVLSVRSAVSDAALRHIACIASLLSLLWPVLILVSLVLLLVLVLVVIPSGIVLHILDRRDQRQHARIKWNL